mgnify:CR=1 FL=1
MKKIIAAVLVIAFALFIFAPLSAFAGGRRGPSTGDIVLGVGGGIVLGTIGVRILDNVFGHPQPVYTSHGYPGNYPISQPVYFPPMSPMYRSPVCAGTLTEEYGWQPDPRGGPPYYVKTGRTFCSGQILY